MLISNFTFWAQLFKAGSSLPQDYCQFWIQSYSWAMRYNRALAIVQWYSLYRESIKAEGVWILTGFWMTSHLTSLRVCSFGMIIAHQKNRSILVRSGFVGTFDAPWFEWSWIIDPDSDHPIGEHPHWLTRVELASKIQSLIGLPVNAQWCNREWILRKIFTCSTTKPQGAQTNCMSTVCSFKI